MDEEQLQAELQAALASKDPEAIDRAAREADRYRAMSRQTDAINEFLVHLRAKERNWYTAQRIDAPELAYLFTDDTASLAPLGGKLTRGEPYAEEYRLRLVGPVRLEPIGVTFTPRCQLISEHAGKALTKVISKNGQFTIEALIITAHLGVGIIAGILQDIHECNFLFKQRDEWLEVWLRTSETGKGSQPKFSQQVTQVEYHHIIAAYNGWETHCVIDGITVAPIPGGAGDLNNWDPEYPLVLGNDLLYFNYSWCGTLRYIAFYSKALSDQQIQALAQSPPPRGG